MPLVVKLTKRFYEDHRDRDLPSGDVVKETKAHYWVSLDAAEYDELLSDASYYASESAEYGSDFAGLCASARAVVKALKAAADKEGV